jgi:ubiquinone/menaquinone biosynthesis C-methylase UbiE
MEQEEVTNTYVFNANDPTELARLINQDRVMTNAMGGPLSGIDNPEALKNIVDFGCGPGGWALDAAFAAPYAEVEGFDSSPAMVGYANARARTQQLPNASFGIMDITRPFELPDASFDLVNARFLLGVLKREAWFPFLQECHRVLRPGGLLRVTEAVEFGQTTNEAVNELLELSRQVVYQLGYGFAYTPSLNLLPMLLSYVKQQRYETVRVHATGLDYSTGTDAWADMHHNIDLIAYQMKPLLMKFCMLNEELFDTLHQAAVIAMQSPAFCGIVHITTIMGQKPAH